MTVDRHTPCVKCADRLLTIEEAERALAEAADILMRLQIKYHDPFDWKIGVWFSSFGVSGGTHESKRKDHTMSDKDKDSVSNKSDGMRCLSQDAVPLNVGDHRALANERRDHDADHGRGSLRNVRDSVSPPPRPNK